jgi:hypothetical protein
MPGIFSILLICSLLFIAFHDFRDLTIPVYLLLIAISIAILRSIFASNLNMALSLGGINILGCSALILITFLVVFLYKGKLFNPFNSLMGIGDLVFFPVLCFSFSPLNFIAFFILSLALILVVKLIFFRSGKVFPLAGGQSVILCIAIIGNEIGRFNMFNDNYLINLLYS